MSQLSKQRTKGLAGWMNGRTDTDRQTGSRQGLYKFHILTKIFVVRYSTVSTFRLIMAVVLKWVFSNLRLFQV